jgi:hypothetical protein
MRIIFVLVSEPTEVMTLAKQFCWSGLQAKVPHAHILLVETRVRTQHFETKVDAAFLQRLGWDLASLILSLSLWY